MGVVTTNLVLVAVDVRRYGAALLPLPNPHPDMRGLGRAGGPRGGPALTLPFVLLLRSFWAGHCGIPRGPKGCLSGRRTLGCRGAKTGCGTDAAAGTPSAFPERIVQPVAVSVLPISCQIGSAYNTRLSVLNRKPVCVRRRCGRRHGVPRPVGSAAVRGGEYPLPPSKCFPRPNESPSLVSR